MHTHTRTLYIYICNTFNAGIIITNKLKNKVIVLIYSYNLMSNNAESTLNGIKNDLVNNAILQSLRNKHHLCESEITSLNHNNFLNSSLKQNFQSGKVIEPKRNLTFDNRTYKVED